MSEAFWRWFRGLEVPRSRGKSASRLPQARPYADPYVAGTCLGLVLLAAFVIAGRGLGASGAVFVGDDFSYVLTPRNNGPVALRSAL